MALNLPGEMIFYEIKTYNSIKPCIREAIGQLLEYAYWPDTIQANRLIIISHKQNGLEGVAKYMKNIRSITSLPIFYQFFDLESNTLSKEY